jgi:hypothetical protein
MESYWLLLLLLFCCWSLPLQKISSPSSSSGRMSLLGGFRDSVYLLSIKLLETGVTVIVDSGSDALGVVVQSCVKVENGAPCPSPSKLLDVSKASFVPCSSSCACVQNHCEQTKKETFFFTFLFR